LATLEKLGVPTGFHVRHPISGEPIPVWIGNYVLSGYGEGAVMGVPAHDERDFAFAKKYGLPIRQVIDIEGKTFSDTAWQDWYADKHSGTCVGSGPFNGLRHAEAVEAVATALEGRGLGRRQTQFRLRDWGISRQRYWGTPIPIIHCPDCGPVPVPESDLPVVLPEDLVPDGSGNPLNKCEAFLRCTCPSCGKAARRETDTMDTFVDSSWYFMRYCSPDSANAMVDDRCRYWMPMDQYIGGIEHAVLHLLYARFWTKVMRDLGVVDFGEPFTRLFTQGMLLNDCFFREDESGRKRWFYPSEVQLQTDERGRVTGAVAKEDGQAVSLGGIEKMSKSKNNVVEPRDIIARFGADTARAFVMFAGPPDQSAAWSDAGAEGTHRFLRRLWSFASGAAAKLNAKAAIPASLNDARFELHKLLGQIEYDYERLQYNTVVSGAMKLLNQLEAIERSDPSGGLLFEGLGILLRVLYPVCPHITQALWHELGFESHMGELIHAAWPQPDPQALQRDRVELVVQVNGKLRGSIRVAVDADRDTVAAAVLSDEALGRFITGEVRKVVLVPGKLVNLVVA
jgi:leucyl-tRNA synthetase